MRRITAARSAACSLTDRVEALIVQKTSPTTGLCVNLKTPSPSGPTGHRARSRCASTSSPSKPRTRYIGSDPNLERYDPDLWTDEYNFLNQPGQADIQSDLFYDYRTNVDAYPRWQAWMQKTQPCLLVIWGKYELSFDPSEPEAYRRDVPKARNHIVMAAISLSIPPPMKSQI